MLNNSGIGGANDEKVSEIEVGMQNSGLATSLANRL